MPTSSLSVICDTRACRLASVSVPVPQPCPAAAPESAARAAVTAPGWRAVADSAGDVALTTLTTRPAASEHAIRITVLRLRRGTDCFTTPPLRYLRCPVDGGSAGSRIAGA